MTDPFKGMYLQKRMQLHKRYFKAEYEDAGRRLAQLGGKLEPGVHDYQAFTFTMPGLRLVFYPHKTSAGHRHIRVRTEGRADQELLALAIQALRKENYSCTFQFPSNRDLERRIESKL